jgi:hypothetical protein
MAFDFLGYPEEGDLERFEEFFGTELDLIDTKIKSVKANLEKLRYLRDKLTTEYISRGIADLAPVDQDADVPDNPIFEGNEYTRFDTDAAQPMYEFKRAMLEAIKGKVERLEFALKRTYYSISVEKESLARLEAGRETLLENYEKSKGLIQEFNLTKKVSQETETEAG